MNCDHKSQKKIQVAVGAGQFARVNPRFEGWILTEEADLNLLTRTDWEKKFRLDSVTTIVAEHVWEHLTFDEGVQAAKICYDFLKPGGFIRCAVPDGFFPNEEYQNGVKIGGPGPIDHPAESHKIVHTYQTLSTMFEAAGFQVRLLEYCDENGDFHANEWNENEGFIYRTIRFDHRNQNGEIGFVSLLVDAMKK